MKRSSKTYVIMISRSNNRYSLKIPTLDGYLKPHISSVYSRFWTEISDHVIMNYDAKIF